MANYSVLIAEPDAAQRQIAEMLLLVHGCEVTMALNAREALVFLQNNTPDLIIASTELPQMNGFDLSRKARGVRRLRNVPVILTAPEGTPLEDARNEAELVGADLLLLKPLGDKNLGERAVALIRQAAETPVAGKQRPSQAPARTPGKTRLTSSPASAENRANVLTPVSSGESVPESDEIKQLRLVIADLTAENDTLRKQLTATGRATSGGASSINDLRDRLTRAGELLEEYRKRYPDLESEGTEGKAQGGLGRLLRRKL